MLKFSKCAAFQSIFFFISVFIIFAELLIEYQQVLNFLSTREFQSAKGEVYTRDREAFLATISSFCIKEGYIFNIMGKILGASLTY